MPLVGPPGTLIPDQTIDWVDLTQSVSGSLKTAFDLSQLNFKNSLALALELQALTNTDIDPNLSFFVDTFTDEDEIDPASLNYEINPVEGYVGLIQGGNFISKDSTKSQFDSGQFTNTESLNDVGGDGAIRKLQLISGNVTVLEDFENCSNVYYDKYNLVFKHTFEDGTLNGWTFNPQNDGNTGISTTVGIIVGAYGVRVDGNDVAYSPVFDCSGKTGIKFRVYVAGISLEGAETMIIGWYDGSTWQTITEVINNQNGYIEFDISDAWLSASNQIAFDLSNNNTLFGGTNAGNDSGYFDDVEVYYYTQEQIPQGSSQLEVYEGLYSGKMYVNFSEESTVANISLPSTNILLYKYVRLFMYKPSDGNYRYKITITDSSDATWVSAELDFPSAHNWFKWEELISNITGIDKTAIVKFKIELLEVLSDIVVWDKSYQPASTNFDTFSNVDVDSFQTFMVDEVIEVGRIEIGARITTNQPRVSFYIAIANVFGTTYASARFDGNQVPADGSVAYIMANFDNNITLYPGNTYKLLFYTIEDTYAYFWEVKLTNNNFYTEGDFFFNGSIQSNDLSFRLMSPAVNEYLYLDALQIESESTYQSTGSFTSRTINLGITPATLSKLYWEEEPSAFDTLRARIRFATTEAGLASASWSSWFTDPTGVGNNLTGIIPYQWYQYEIEWTGGSTSDSDYLRSISLDYTGEGGTGSSTIISIPEILPSIPTKFMVFWQDDVGTGSINYYISRDGNNTWQSIPTYQKGQLVDFTSNPGTSVQLKAITTGNAKLYGWSVGTL